jgi:hypothetical protein
MCAGCRHRRHKRKGLRKKLKGLFGGNKEQQTGAWGAGERDADGVAGGGRRACICFNDACHPLSGGQAALRIFFFLKARLTIISLSSFFWSRLCAVLRLKFCCAAPALYISTLAGDASYGGASSDYSASSSASEPGSPSSRSTTSSQKDWPDRPPERKTGTIPKATKGIVDALSPGMIGKIVKTMGPGMTFKILNVLGE